MNRFIIKSKLNRIRVVSSGGGGSGIPGPKGDTGAGVPGPQGQVGATGPRGLKGDTGDTGAQGVQGLIGLTGNTGPTGSQGPQGSQGTQGIQGVKGDKGDTGNTGAAGQDGTGVSILGSLTDESELPVSGNPGDAYLIDGDLFVWSDTTSDWTNVGHIEGPQGIQGVAGATGAQGPQGVAGATGAQGTQGVKGDAGDPATNLVTSVAGKQGVVTLNKTDVGLPNVDNTADTNKPISTATQNALNNKANLTHTHTASQISDSTTVGRAVVTATDATAARTAIGAGTSSLVIGTTSTTAKAGDYTPTKADVGLGNVTNTSDANKPVSTAQQAALDLKPNTSALAGVAFSGEYADLLDKPDLSDKARLTNDQVFQGINQFSYGIILLDSTAAQWLVTVNTDGSLQTTNYFGAGGFDSGFLSEDGQNYFITEDAINYLAQEA